MTDEQSLHREGGEEEMLDFLAEVEQQKQSWPAVLHNMLFGSRSIRRSESKRRER